MNLNIATESKTKQEKQNIERKPEMEKTQYIQHTMR
jgi:hypothetical protein